MKTITENTTYKHRFVCDRCERKHEFTSNDEYSVKVEGWNVLDTNEVHLDLCPFCASELAKWVNQPLKSANAR